MNFYLKTEQPQSLNEFVVVVVVIDIDIESNSHRSFCHATHIHTHRTPSSILEYLVRICVAYINMTFSTEFDYSLCFQIRFTHRHERN